MHQVCTRRFENEPVRSKFFKIIKPTVFYRCLFSSCGIAGGLQTSLQKLIFFRIFKKSRASMRSTTENRGESAALGHFSVSIYFGQVDNKESKNKYSSIAV